VLQIKLVVVSEDLRSKKPVVLMVNNDLPAYIVDETRTGCCGDINANTFFEKATGLSTKQISLKFLKIRTEGFDDVIVFTHYYGCFLPSDIPSPNYEWVDISVLVNTDEYEIITNVADR